MIKKIISLIGLFFGAVSVTSILIVTIVQFFIPHSSILDLLILDAQFFAILVVGVVISVFLTTKNETMKYFGIFNVFFGITFAFATVLILFRMAIEVNHAMSFGITSILQIAIGIILLRCTVVKNQIQRTSDNTPVS